jgi:hypothetical protein
VRPLAAPLRERRRRSVRRHRLHAPADCDSPKAKNRKSDKSYSAVNREYTVESLRARYGATKVPRLVKILHDYLLKHTPWHVAVGILR